MSKPGATPGALEVFLALRGARTMSLRLNVGCEHVKDLWDDLSHALAVSSRYA